MTKKSHQKFVAW